MGMDEIVIKLGVQGANELNQALKIAGLSFKQFNKYINQNSIVLGKTNDIMDQATGKIRKNLAVHTKTIGVYDQLTGKQMVLGNVMRQTTIQSRRFKMEWLSIMFAGMAISRVFGAIVQSQFQLWGVTEGMTAMWQTVMLPVMEEITPLLWDMIDAIMNLPEDVKLGLGSFILAGDVIGKLMMVVGQFFLAMMGLKLLFPGLATKLGKTTGIFARMGIIIKSIGVALGKLGAAFGVFAAIIAVTLVGMFLAWKEDFMNMKGVVADFFSTLISAFKNLFKVFEGIVDFFVAVFTGDFEGAKDAVVKILTNLKAFVQNLFLALMNFIGAIGIGIIRIIMGLVQTLVNAFLAGWSLIKKGFSDVFNWIGDKISWLIDKINNLIGKMNVFKGAGNFLGKIGIPGFQTGGLVTQTGPAMLHRGEKVLPKGRAGTSGEIMFAPTVYITSTINNEMDVRILAEKLNKYWAADFVRLTQGRAI